MDRSTIIGIILAIIGVGVGMVLKGVSVLALFNPAALLIIFVGTAAAVMIAFPMSTIKKVPTLFRIIFKEEKSNNAIQVIDLFTEWADVARKEGILVLEQKLSDVDDSFLKSGIQLAIDGQEPEFIRDVLMEKVEAMEQRHQKGAKVFSQAGTYAPTLGVLGAVIGLVAALAHMEDIDALGHAISAAFIATLFGIFSGYVLWHPFANKLKEKSKNEAEAKYMMIEGILSITNGQSPTVVRDKLGSYLSETEFNRLLGEREDADA